ncbi:MAG TPA: EamA family transporter, partial [Naasia sp.]
MAKRGVGIGIAVLSAAAFGSGGAFVPPLLDAGWTAGTVSLIRTSGAALLLAIPALLALRGRWGDVRRQGFRVAAYGGLAIAGTQFAYYQALGRIPVGTALMIEYLAPVLLVAATALVARRLPAPTVLVGSALALGGLALVLDLSGQAGADVLGLLWALAAAVLCASYFALSASIDLPPVGLAGLGMLTASLSTGAFAAFGLIPVAIGTRSVTMGGAQLSPLVPLLFITVVATVLAYLTGIAAARILGGRRASFLALSEVLWAV